MNAIPWETGVEKDLEQAGIWFRAVRKPGYMPAATEEEFRRMEDVPGTQANVQAD